ncbi:MAG: hypothetical protein K0Q49_1787 [Haloplasmataceae bacterium]|nr:hypothetical protein [Haloplasmataceae bacterium]
MSELLSIKNDLVFKMLFGNEKNKDLLISFLQSVLKMEPSQLCDLIISNQELLPEYKKDKLSILDVKIILKTGELINIEIQVAPYKYMEDRIIFYTSKMISSQLSSSDDYKKLKKCINITILDFNLTKSKKAHSIYKNVEIEEYIQLTDITEIHILELKKINHADHDLLSLWLRFINTNNKEELLMLSTNNEYFKKAYDEIEKLSLDPNARELYEARAKWLRDTISRYNEAEEKGLEKGMEKGIEKGIIMVRKQIALKLLNANMGINFISETTGLTETEILNLNNSKN